VLNVYCDGLYYDIGRYRLEDAPLVISALQQRRCRSCTLREEMGSFSPGLAIGFHSPSTERSTELVIDNDVLGLLLLAHVVQILDNAIERKDPLQTLPANSRSSSKRKTIVKWPCSRSVAPNQTQRDQTVFTST
jgi:hypothetical protein